MALILKNSKRKPWDFLNDWQQSDRGYDPDELKTINVLMQAKFPGPYKVVKKTSPHGRFIYYEMEYDSDPAATMFRLKWA